MKAQSTKKDDEAKEEEGLAGNVKGTKRKITKSPKSLRSSPKKISRMGKTLSVQSAGKMNRREAKSVRKEEEKLQEKKDIGNLLDLDNVSLNNSEEKEEGDDAKTKIDYFPLRLLGQLVDSVPNFQVISNQLAIDSNHFNDIVRDETLYFNKFSFFEEIYNMNDVFQYYLYPSGCGKTMLLLMLKELAGMKPKEALDELRNKIESRTSGNAKLDLSSISFKMNLGTHPVICLDLK